jgi:hypothetical protein
LLETPIDDENLDYFLEAYDEGADRNPPGALFRAERVARGLVHAGGCRM